MKYFIYIFLIAITLTSCFKKEKPITLPEATSEISTHFMGDDMDHYSKQLYFDLSTNTFYENKLTDWDMCFESSDNGKGIFLNTGTEIRFCKSGFFYFSSKLTTDTNYIKSQMDKFELFEGSDGKVETSALRDWETYHTLDLPTGGVNPGIYFIELKYLYGKDRFRRLQVISANDQSFTCNFTDLNNDTTAIIKIPKDKSRNFTFYSFRNGGRIVENIEPPKDEWDIEFTQYGTPIPPTFIKPYLVRGVFSNRNKVMVATDFSTKFEDITESSIANDTFSSYRDAIGYDKWKAYDNASGKYVVNSNITYIIKDTDGFYYKLRFLDFYDKLGNTGNPKFEYIRIK